MSRIVQRVAAAAIVAILVMAPFAWRWDVVDRAWPGVNREQSGGLLYLSDIPLLLALAAFAIWLIPRNRHVETGPAAVTLPLLGLTALASLSAGWAPSPSAAADAALHRAALLGLYLALLNVGPPARWSAAALAAGAAGQGTVALAQFLQQQPLGLTALGEVDLLVGGDCSWLRAAGLSAHANILGGYAAVGLVAGIGLATATKTRRLAVGVALGFSLGGVLATASRSALLGLLAGLAVLLVARYGPPGRRWLTYELVLAAAAVAIVVAALGGCATRRLTGPVAYVAGLDQTSEGTSAAVGRWELVRVAGVLAAAHPLGGVGDGNFAIAWQLRGEPKPIYLYEPVHNVGALVAAELGFPGAFAWAALWAGVLVTAWRRRHSGDEWQTVWLSALAVVFVVGILDFYPWGWEQGRVLFFALLGLWAQAVARAQMVGPMQADLSDLTPSPPSLKGRGDRIAVPTRAFTYGGCQLGQGCLDAALKGGPKGA